MDSVVVCEPGRLDPAPSVLLATPGEMCDRIGVAKKCGESGMPLAMDPDGNVCECVDVSIQGESIETESTLNS